MESHAERGEVASAAVPCIAHHKCHSCERTRSFRVRMLSWVLGKFSLLLIIIVTSATTTFLYHKLLPDDASGAGAGQMSSSSQDRHEARHTNSVSGVTNHLSNEGMGRQGTMAAPGSTRTAARLGLLHLNKDAHLTMTTEGPKFFTSGHVVIEGGALVVQRSTTLFLSADVILNSMFSQGQRGPSTVVVCLSLARGENALQKPITCQLTYLRERDQQMARVWMLFQAQAKDKIYVNTSWPTYFVSDNRDNQESVFQAFEV